MILYSAEMHQSFPMKKAPNNFFLRGDRVLIGYDKNPSSHPFPDETEE